MVKHVNILGTKYDVYFLPESELQYKDTNGYCERWTKEIFINEDVFDPNQSDAVKNIHLAKNKTVRHEIIHAVLHESGLEQYCEDEILVDALATLFPKMYQIFKHMEIEE